jgi:hypothetical protein
MILYMSDMLHDSDDDVDVDEEDLFFFSSCSSFHTFEDDFLMRFGGKPALYGVDER